MKKYMLLLFILLVALLTSCNLDNQGIFAEVLDRVPSDNRRISLIGSKNNNVYFSSKNGIESYNLVSGVYTTIDGSAEAKKSNRFILDGDKIIYFVESANSITPKYDGYYSINISTKEKKSLDGSANTDIFCGAFDKYLINKNGDVFSTSVDANNNISFIPEATAHSNTRFVKNIDNILVYTTSASGIPDTSSLVYYYFDGTTDLKPIGSNLGDLRSVAKDTSNSSKVLTFSKTNEGTSFYKLESNQLSKIYSFSTVYKKDFASFIDNGNVYYAYDGSSSFNKLSIQDRTISSTTISKISTVSIIGYFKVGDNYKICTTNNGFFTLSVSGTPTIL
ncbi:hypothetical protein [Bullifex porci]|uniref:hypothetical protein n=1 Tax=Bullifex porci TaxID=2606638 RepID=UPI0023F25C5B|nr:hypothetical protein [Bullifex porci]MDD7254934.1 hypothetical protein [Bullifex porci]MDY2741619.1 hypothetical protein [Bullifex porci]